MKSVHMHIPAWSACSFIQSSEQVNDRALVMQDALHELALMGYTSGDSLAAARRSEKFDFA